MPRRVVAFVVLCILGAIPLKAQTAPCGRMIVAVTAADKQTEERFLPAPPEHVKASVIRALPAVGAKIKEDHGLTFSANAGQTTGIFLSWFYFNERAGVKGLTAGTAVGSYEVGLRPESREGAVGTLIKIVFQKRFGVGFPSKGATQLMEEVSCLSQLISQADPVLSPRGLVGPSETAEGSTVTLPEGTPLKLVLRDPLYSGDLGKDAKGSPLVFEVADDVSFGGISVVRKGALGTGRITEGEKARYRGREAKLSFEF
ncbi:MAG: hypothetical protein EHM71_17315, partial [Zetaproteobacteria bacterium]